MWEVYLQTQNDSNGQTQKFTNRLIKGQINNAKVKTEIAITEYKSQNL